MPKASLLLFSLVFFVRALGAEPMAIMLWHIMKCNTIMDGSSFEYASNYTFVYGSQTDGSFCHAVGGSGARVCQVDE
jgi:hypothetical protein